ncbi:MAG: hypothetical protein KAI50_11620 [Desulfobacterales bacterium]|nr:hypothetical protein [Desulfobacterales bacterium]
MKQKFKIKSDLLTGDTPTKERQAIVDRFDGRVLQYLGRVLRPAPGKTSAKLYVDIRVGVLRVSAKARQKVYRGE